MSKMIKSEMIGSSSGKNIGRMLFYGEDANAGTYDFASWESSFSADDFEKSLLEAVTYAQKDGFNPWVQRAHFTNCRIDRTAQNLRNSNGVYKRPFLAINHIYFTDNGEEGNGQEMLRAFVDMLKTGEAFNITPEAEHYLRVVELEFISLGSGEYDRIKWLADNIPSFRVLKLEDCLIGNDNFPLLINAIRGTKICVVEVPGDSISDDNRKLLSQTLQENREIAAQEPLSGNPRYRNYVYFGQQLKIPQNGGVLDLSNLEIKTGDGHGARIKRPELLHALSYATPEKIHIINCEDRSYHWPNLLMQGGLMFAETVKEINLTNSMADMSSISDVAFLSEALESAFYNTEVVICDNNDLSSRSAGGYMGGPLCNIVSAHNLKICSFANCEMGDNAIMLPCVNINVCLTAKPASESLCALNLSGNPLTDVCVPKLLEWVENSNITQLVLKGTEISPVNLRKLGTAALDNAKRLGEEPMAYEFPTYFAAQVANNDNTKSSITPEQIRDATLERKGGGVRLI